MQRTKGANGEREFIRLLQPVVDEVLGEAAPRLQRNSLQSDTGGFDVVGLPWLALEVKRCEQLAVNRWWQQTVKQAGLGQTPVLAYRQSRRPWAVMMPVWVGEVSAVGTVSFDAFADYLRAELRKYVA